MLIEKNGQVEDLLREAMIAAGVERHHELVEHIHGIQRKSCGQTLELEELQKEKKELQEGWEKEKEQLRARVRQLRNDQLARKLLIQELGEAITRGSGYCRFGQGAGPCHCVDQEVARPRKGQEDGQVLRGIGVVCRIGIPRVPSRN